MIDHKKKMTAALLKHFVPRVRALGFNGGLSGLRRLTESGVDVLIIPLERGAVQLDAGRVQRRGRLAARTVREDWALFANPRTLPHRASRRRLESSDGTELWFYEDIRSAAQFVAAAREMADVVQTAGEAFWATPLPSDPPARRRARVMVAAREKELKQLLQRDFVPRLRALGFTGGAEGVFRRQRLAMVELVSVSIGGGSVLLEAATRRAGRRARSPHLDFVNAANRVELVEQRYDVPSVNLERLVQKLTAAVPRHLGM